MRPLPWPTLRAEPALPPALHAALVAARQRLVLPPLVDLDPLVLVRFLWRLALAQSPDWRPLVHVEASHAQDGLGDSLRLAHGGWLYVSGGLRLDEAPGVALIEVGGGRPLALEAAPRLRQLDAHHLAASDPTLALQRDTLRALWSAHATLTLRGPIGSGRSSLARAVHAAAEAGPLAVIGGPGASLAPGRPTLLIEPASLPPAALAPLKARLDQRSASPAAVDASPAPPRPVDPAFAAIIGQSAPLRRVLHEASRAATRGRPVLILGERGTGKEDLARAIHAASGRSGPLIPLNLAALPATLVDAALFGAEAGAFTGARPSPGAFRQAHKGTLFLDEFGDIGAETQAGLLRAIQFGEVRPLGASRTQQVDVLVIAATNVDLDRLIERGEWRADLTDRFGPRERLSLPPLRERSDDIPLLAAHFAAARGRRLSPAAIEQLVGRDWPGNVRLLRQVVEAACEDAEDWIEPAHLGPNPGRAPFVVVSSEPPESLARAGLLRRDQAQLLATLSVEVPSLAERGPAAITAAVLAGVEGRPVQAEALRALASHPWPSEGAGLAAALAVLRQRAGLIDRDAVARVLPRGGDRRLLRLMVSPALDENEEISGFVHDSRAPAVVIGRASRMEELRPDPALPADDPLALRHQALLGLLGGVRPAFVRVEPRPGLARAHVLLCRDDSGGLVVHRLPHTELPVEAGPAGVRALLPVHPHSPVSIGRAGELRIGGEGGARLFAAVGLDAWQDATPALRDALASLAASPTLLLRGSPPPHPREAPAPALPTLPAARGHGPWPLDPVEEAALTDFIVETCRMRAPWASRIRAWASAQAEPALGRLAAYLLRTANPGQQLRYLVEADFNEGLPARVGAGLAALPGAPGAWAHLQSELRRRVPMPGGG